MHPEFAVMVLQVERRREAAEARRHSLVPREARPSWREALGHRLVGLGLRLATA